MNRNDLILLAKLRLLVGYLGEKDQYGWWSCSFFSRSSDAFLRPVFGKTSFLAKYYGVKEAATRVHDEHIGVGRNVYHLFRLPEQYEQELHSLLCEPDLVEQFKQQISDQTTAFNSLKSIGDTKIEPVEGPVRIGGLKDLYQKENWQTVAQYYRNSFEIGYKIFPFFSEVSEGTM